MDTVRSAITITISDVLQLGIISKIHMRAANTNSAITLCWTTVRASIPKKDVGTAHRKMKMRSTRGRNTHILRLNFFSIAIFYFSYSKRISTGIFSSSRATTSCWMAWGTKA